MSKGARLRAQKARQIDYLRRPPGRPRPGEDIQTAFIPGLALNNDEGIEQMHRESHDTLINLVGPRRRSGVSWRHVHGHAEIESTLRTMYEESPEQLAGIETEYLPFLAEHGENAVMVIAYCEAVVAR